jgi:hypothetical protein
MAGEELILMGGADGHQNVDSVPPAGRDLSLVVVERLAPLAALIGRSRSVEVRAEVIGRDPYFRYYWRHIGWIAAMAILLSLAVLFGVLASTTGQDTLGSIGMSVGEAGIGCALLSGLYGARWSAYQRHPRLATSFPGLFMPRSIEVVIVFVLWLLVQLLMFL